MPLKSQTVDWIFAKMAVRYGSTWVAKWNGLPMEAVAHDWATVLERFKPEAITYGLMYLPLEFPPTATEFAAICRRMPEREPPPKQIEGPPADPKRVAEMLARALEKMKKRPARQWAYDMQEREAAGELLSESQRKAWREALVKAPIDNAGGYFSPIDPACLPPGMRAELSGRA